MKTVEDLYSENQNRLQGEIMNSPINEEIHHNN